MTTGRFATSRLDVRDFFPEITAEVRRRTVAALNAAAVAGALAADRAANSPKPIARFTVLPARGTDDGFASGVNAGPLTRIFDKGSLGKHQGRTKRPGKASWEVNRGTNPYLARRGDVEGEGIAPRRIFNQARKAGRDALRRRLTHP